MLRWQTAKSCWPKSWWCIGQWDLIATWPLRALFLLSNHFFFFFSLNSYKSLDLCLTIRYFLRVLPLSSVSLSVSRSFFLVKLRCYRSSGNGFDYTRAFHASGGQSSRWNVGDGATIRPPPNFQAEFYPVCSSISRMVVWCKIIDSKKIFFSPFFLDLLFEIRQGRPRNRP